ncbi:uncharacterized protein BDZ99DRAFT_147810 [Mytilinidion resinicola]|uniref:Secreted protein n=1 Tax=Mytilinidion resinicola TaxID=574789 RepID=A0A6A6Y8W5_9PEZI|nr:uncharacterized protein BDZ99DRAFT_147810 [Mytilinidion resinicola]KAF2804575.1 hypothetical protein BDZ99DRAFT_147810 [Mytilinidion resinicola]
MRRGWYASRGVWIAVGRCLGGWCLGELTGGGWCCGAFPAVAGLPKNSLACTPVSLPPGSAQGHQPHTSLYPASPSAISTLRHPETIPFSRELLAGIDAVRVVAACVSRLVYSCIP